MIDRSTGALSRRALLYGIGAAALTGPAVDAAAQTYPSRTVKIVVPYPAGGITDVLPRMLKIWRNALMSGQPWEDAFRLRRGSDGMLRWLRDVVGIRGSAPTPSK